MYTDRLVNTLHFVGAMILFRLGSIFNDTFSHVGGWIVLILGLIVMYGIHKKDKN